MILGVGQPAIPPEDEFFVAMNCALKDAFASLQSELQNVIHDAFEQLRLTTPTLATSLRRLEHSSTPISDSEVEIVHSHLWKARCKQVALTSTAATGGVKKPYRFGLGASTIQKIAKYQKRSSAASLLLDDAISTQSNHNLTSLGLVSGTDSSVPDLNFVNNGCGSSDYVPGAMLSGVDTMIFDNEKRSLGMTVIDSGDGRKLSEHEGIGVKLDGMQGPYSCECHALKVFDEMSTSDGFCGSKVAALTSIRDKGGGLAQQPLDLAACFNHEEDNYGGFFNDKEQVAFTSHCVSKALNIGTEIDESANAKLEVETLCEHADEELQYAIPSNLVSCEHADEELQYAIPSNLVSFCCLYKHDNLRKLSNEMPEYDALQLLYKRLQLEGLASDRRGGDVKYAWLLESVIVPIGDKNFMAYFHEALQSIPYSYQDWRARLNWSSAAMIQCSINPIVFVDTILLGDIDKGVSLNYISKMEITANIVGKLDGIGRWKIHITSGTTVGAGCAQEFNLEFFGRFVVLFKGSVTSPNNEVAKSYGDRGFAAQWYVQECDKLLLKAQKKGSGSMESKVASDTTLDEASIDISEGTQGFIKVVEVKDLEVYIGEQHVLDSSSVTNLVHMFSLRVAEISITDVPNKAELQKPQQVDMSSNSFLFQPDKFGLTRLTFVDVAASTESDLLECGDHKIQELMRPYVTMHSDHEGRYVSTCNSSKSVELHALQKGKDKRDIACIAGQALVVLNVFGMHHTLSFGFLIGGGKDAEAAKKCLQVLVLAEANLIQEFSKSIAVSKTLQVDDEGTKVQGQAMAPLISMLIDQKKCQEDHVVIKIAALKIYLCWCLLCGKMQDDNGITHHSSVEVDKSASHMRLVFEKEEGFMVIGHDIADEIALNERGVAEIASKIVMVITRVDDVLEFSSMGSMEVMIVGMSNIIVPELICRAEGFGTQTSIARAIADVVGPNSKSIFAQKNAKSLLLFLADGILKPMSSSSFASALSKACESDSAVRYEPTNLELWMWIGEGLEESHFPLEDIILLLYCDGIITQFLKYLSSNQLQQSVKSLTSSCFGDLPLTMIWYSFWMIKAEHKGMSCLPFEDSKYSTIPWPIYIFLGLGVALCGITYSVLFAAYIASGATTQGNMLHDKVLDSSTYSDDSTDDSPGINRRRGYLGRSFGYHGSFSRFSDLTKA